MKKVLIIFSVIIVILLTALLVIPIFFKGDILQIIQNQSSKYINAELKIGEVNLSMFKSFPDLNVTLKNLTITGENEFQEDTIVNIPLFRASLNLKSLISGDRIIVNQILLQNCRFTPTVTPSGKANWDILIKHDTNTTTVQDILSDHQKQEPEKELELNNIAIENLYIAYKDYKNSDYASIGNINLQLAGNLSTKNTLVTIVLALNDISYRHQNSIWVNRTDLNWQSEIAVNLQDQIFEIKKNDLAINELKLELTGKVARLPGKFDVNLRLNAPDTKFESLLSLVPKALQNHIKDLETQGNFKLEMIAQGEYYENHFPCFHANLQVDDAKVKYPELPEAIQKINIDLNINHPEGSIDSTRINLRKMSFDIAGNPFNMFLNIINPNDPQLDGGAIGVIDFASLKKAFPLKDITLQGMITTNVAFNGKYQFIEKEQYEKFVAKGSIVFKDILFVNTEFPKGISIPQGSIVITPANLNLNKLQARIYSSDFLLQGKISNYLPYIFKNEILKGNFALTSNQIDLNEFIIAQAAKQNTANLRQDTIQKTATPNPSASKGALEIPKNIDIQFSTNINTIIFDKLYIKNVKGNVNLSKAVANLKNLSLDMLKGNMILNGQYNTLNPKTPIADFNVQISDFDIHEVYNSFTFIKKSLPVAMNCNGKVSAAMKFSSILDQEMSPIMSTTNGGGYLESNGILINDNPVMNQLAGFFKNDELNRLSISQLKINFKLENGNITIEPFKTTFAGNPVTIYGNQTVNGELDYTLSMTVNRKSFGRDINNLLKSIPGSGNIQTLDLDAKIGGTLSNPIIKPDLSKAIKAVTKEAEKELKGNGLKGLQNLFKKK